MTTLLIGFDPAWTAENSGALVGVLCAGQDGVAGKPDSHRPEKIDFEIAVRVQLGNEGVFYERRIHKVGFNSGPVRFNGIH
jgi:hypothetical protein